MTKQSDSQPERSKKKGAFQRAVEEAQAMAGATAEVEDGYTLFRYPDYATYRAVQTAGNKAKLKRQFVKESHVARLAEEIRTHLGKVSFGLCHGTRRGNEQAWFTAHLGASAEVIGTEISDTATEFLNTVQWDFHDENPVWAGRADFVYSNSWDHAFNPAKAFEAWFAALRPGGWMLLDHTKEQAPESSNALDPFGVTFERLEEMLRQQFAGRGDLFSVLDYRKTNPEYRARVVVLQKGSAANLKLD